MRPVNTTERQMPRPLAPTSLQRKLHRWELHHLRQVVADQQTQIEAQAAELATLKRELSWAEQSAESWRADALQAIEDAGCMVGLTQTGQVLAVQPGRVQ